MKHNRHLIKAYLCILSATNACAAITYVNITGDADSGISSSNTYTHALDFGNSDVATVNGVSFVGYLTGSNGSNNFSASVSSGSIVDSFPNANHNVTGDLADLLTDMYFNNGGAAGGTATWTLSGLTAGQAYDARIYVRTYGDSAGNRDATLVFDHDGAGGSSLSTGTINEDDATGSTPGFSNFNDAYYINYRFTAVAGEDLVITATQDIANSSWHLYGLTNQVVPEPSSLTLAALGTLVCFRRRR